MNNPETSEKSTKNTLKFVLITVASSPLWLIAALLFFLPFGLLYTVASIITVAFVLLLISCVACGVAVSLTGIVYGIIKIPSVLPIGLYEIGFGVICAGVTMLVGILIYNLIVRVMPIVFGLCGKLFRYTFGRIKPLLSSYKRWCESR